MGESKDPVRIRRRRLANGTVSLYLDIYRGGRRSYEFLRMYLVPEKTRKDKEKNRETMGMAEAVRAKRIVELRNGEYGFRQRGVTETRFFDYYASLMERRRKRDTGGNWYNWKGCLRHLERYEPRRNIALDEITPQWVEGFRDYLEREAYAYDKGYLGRDERKPLSPNSRQAYFNKLRACLRQAREDGLTAGDPLRGVEALKGEEGTRMYLTIDEIRRAAQTPCGSALIRRAFLFSCLTGLRRSDVMRLAWGDISEQGGFTRIIFRQKKTKGQEYLDITAEAAVLLGERGGNDERPFGALPCPNLTNYYIRQWMERAGISKPITFHCARHSFATMMLDLGTDIYTVSKLLGHRELSTTQIYAKVLDKNKQAAVASIPAILTPEDAGKGAEEGRRD